MYHLKTWADVEIWVKAEGDSNHSLSERQLLFCPNQTQTQVVKLFSSFSRLLYRMNGLSVFCAAPLSPLLLCSLCSLSVQQCPSEHEDPAAEPDGFDGELGTPSDRLPPAHHQLHGLLQLGEARRRWREDIHQNCGPENSEYRRLRLKNQTKPPSLPPPLLALCFRSGLNSFLFFFFGETSDACGRIRRWLDQWQCVEEVTGCDEPCLWLLGDMRAQTLPCHSPV